VGGGVAVWAAAPVDGALWMRCRGVISIHQISAPPPADGFRGQPAEEEPAPSDVAWLRSHH
jgi:hypothetical protein